MQVGTADLRGYGASTKPASTADHAPYSKRAMAADLLEVMDRLGHRRFLVVGHDRGSYVAFRLAPGRRVRPDHPEAVAGLAVLDGVPIVEALERCTEKFAAAWWHWFFFAQPDKPERAINVDPDAWSGDDDMAELYGDPLAVWANWADDRRGAVIDSGHHMAEEAPDELARVLLSFGDELAATSPATRNAGRPAAPTR